MKRATSTTVIWGWVFYLTLFSSFALLHAYAEDELIDTHGCVIGAWVQQANAPDSSEWPLAPLPCLVGFLDLPSDTRLAKALPSAASRGPPIRVS